MINQNELIKRLRVITQAGFMDCKKALDITNNDLDAAVKWLRENGIVKAAKKIDSIASEGIIELKNDGNKAILIEINSQTDFVSKSELFLNFVSDLINTLFSSDIQNVQQAKELKLSSGKTVAETEIELTATIGEKISLRRISVVKAKNDEVITSYLHANKRIGVLLTTTKIENATVLKHLAMHIAASGPRFIDKNNVDNIWLQSEKEVIENQVKMDDTVKMKLEKSPEQVRNSLLEKIIEGRINKLLIESCLTSQPYLIDSSKKVEDILRENKLNVISFIRFEVGEGIEKKVDNFVEEVKAQMKQ